MPFYDRLDNSPWAYWDRYCQLIADGSREGHCTLKQDQADALDDIMGPEFWEEHETPDA